MTEHAPKPPPPATAGDGTVYYRFKLFVVGGTPLSMRAEENFAKQIAAPLGDRVEYEVIDLGVTPKIARQERIAATPTLVRLEPAPIVRLIGDLTDFDRVRLLVLAGDDRPAETPPAAGDPFFVGDPPAAGAPSSDLRPPPDGAGAAP